MSSANSDNFTFHNLDYYSFSSLIAIAGTLKTMLGRGGKRRHLCLVPNFRGDAFSSSPLGVMFSCGLVTCSAQSCLTLCDPWTVALQAPLSMGILQARMLEWVAMSSSRGIFPTQVSHITGRFSTD